jgi:hypothetical protein
MVQHLLEGSRHFERINFSFLSVLFHTAALHEHCLQYEVQVDSFRVSVAFLFMYLFELCDQWNFSDLQGHTSCGVTNVMCEQEI